MDFGYTQMDVLKLCFISEYDFNGNASFFKDWLQEKHLDYNYSIGMIEIYIPISEIDKKDVVDNLISCSKLAFLYDEYCKYMFDFVKFEKSHLYMKTATKYPFNACIIGYDGDPIGGVDEEILNDMEKSFAELEKVLNDTKRLREALRVSKQTLSARYIYELMQYKDNPGEIGKIADRWYKSIYKKCVSPEMRNKVSDIVKKEFSISGYKFVKQTNIFGGLPVLIFEKKGMYFYIPLPEIYWFFKRGGQHKVEIYKNDDLNEHEYSVYKIGGGLGNVIKFCNGIKQSNKLIRIASKICLAYTKKDLLSFLKYKLSSDDKWALRALQRIYEGQTIEELNEENTKELNGLGFTGFDAPILTSIYKSYLEHGKNLTPKQMSVVKKMMGKYAGQIYRSSYMNKTQLEKIYTKYLKENLF